MRKPAPPSRQELLNGLLQCGRQFYERRWMWGTSGNLSVKLRQKPLEIAITPSGLNKGSLTPDQLIVLNEKGIPTETVVTHLAPPASRMGPLTPDEYKTLLGNSDLFKKYQEAIDPRSAFARAGKTRSARRGS